MSDTTAPRTVRLRLDLGYDGTGFSGWAVQPGLRTVAGVLSTALSTMFRQGVPLVVAGRTDAGVHAAGQVAHIEVEQNALRSLSPRDPAPLDPAPRNSSRREPDLAGGCAGVLRRLAGLLPRDVRVHAVAVAPDGFDARFSALSRRYRYRVSTHPAGPVPLRRFDTLALGRELDVAAMQRAADQLLGLHDFAAFCKAPANERATTIRTVQSLRIGNSEGEPQVVTLDVVADAFCHSMVRSLVGMLLAVGRHQAPVSEPSALLDRRERTPAVRTVAASGLTLMAVDYPPDSELMARAERTRAMRLPLD